MRIELEREKKHFNSTTNRFQKRNAIEIEKLTTQLEIKNDRGFLQ